MEEKRDVFRVLAETLEGKVRLGRPRGRREDDIKMS